MRRSVQIFGLCARSCTDVHARACTSNHENPGQGRYCTVHGLSPAAQGGWRRPGRWGGPPWGGVTPLTAVRREVVVARLPSPGMVSAGAGDLEKAAAVHVGASSASGTADPRSPGGDVPPGWGVGWGAPAPDGCPPTLSTPHMVGAEPMLGVKVVSSTHQSLAGGSHPQPQGGAGRTHGTGSVPHQSARVQVAWGVLLLQVASLGISTFKTSSRANAPPMITQVNRATGF